ncbi:MAG TPA: hypothetical protein VG869_16980 [Acidimicrobiia bacterium]|nr:hypothetical protein [Acidimicrobiia bacterium]HEV3452880.1 hypothetical protein [Acidimicrobiia bacterium]
MAPLAVVSARSVAWRAARAASGPAGIRPDSRAALRWVAEQHAVRLDVLRHVLDRRRPVSAARTASVVDRWRAQGLVDRGRVLARTTAAVWPTAAGLRAVGLRGRPAPPPLGLLPHLHAVSLVRVAVERAGGAWTSERQLRRERTSPTAHVADGRFRAADGVDTAVEVELTPKGASRLRDIVEELLDDHDAVLYVVEGTRVRTVVQRAVDALDAGRRVAVCDLDWFRLHPDR